jgi:hypothetical protein
MCELEKLLRHLAGDHSAGAAVLCDTEAQGAAKGEAQDATMTLDAGRTSTRIARNPECISMTLSSFPHWL